MRSYHNDTTSSHQHNYFPSMHLGQPLTPYDQNTTKLGSISKLKSPQKHPSTLDPHQPKKPQKKIPFIQPGTPISPFEQILSTTMNSQNGLTTYLIAKALTGPSLHFASQVSKSKQISKKPTKNLPQIPTAISGELTPHLYTYATITHEGLYRKSNDDKLTIYLQQNYKWFSIYDGHGGTACSQFLKQHLHQYFFQLDWKKDIPNSLRKSFIHAQQQWKSKGDNSGSCALVIFIYLNTCYAINLGDSRALLLSDNASKCYQITKDHKPSNLDQQKRIMQAGGKIYQTTAITEINGQYDMIIGPLRVFPGRLSTTRTFGDFQAKDSIKQGNDKVVICQPQITSFQIDLHQMIILGSDGLWDKIDNIEIGQLYHQLKTTKNINSDQQLIAKFTQTLLQQAMKRGSSDNISIIIIMLSNPSSQKIPKKGNEHIKIMSLLHNTNYKNKQLNNKQNYLPDKFKHVDLKIFQINKNVNYLTQSRR